MSSTQTEVNFRSRFENCIRICALKMEGRGYLEISNTDRIAIGSVFPLGGSIQALRFKNSRRHHPRQRTVHIIIPSLHVPSEGACIRDSPIQSLRRIEAFYRSPTRPAHDSGAKNRSTSVATGDSGSLYSSLASPSSCSSRATWSFSPPVESTAATTS